MKRIVSLLLVLPMLLGLFVGCSGTSAAEPPKTAEEFLTQYNKALKKEGVPLEFSLPEQAEEQVEKNSSLLCTMNITDNGASVAADKLELYLLSEESLSGPLDYIQVYAGQNLTDEEQALHRQLSITASLVCDPNMKREQAELLYDGEGDLYSFVSYENNIGSFYRRVRRDDESLEAISYRFCQPFDLTHTYVHRQQIFNDGLGAPMQNYCVYFTAAGESKYAKYDTAYVTVGELEDLINQYFADAGIALECAFSASSPFYSYYDNFLSNPILGNVGYVYHTLSYRFTCWDDPDTPYPQIMSYNDTDIPFPHYAYYGFPFGITIGAKGITRDAPIYDVEFTQLHSLTYGSDDYIMNVWDDSWRELADGLLEQIIAVWSERVHDDAIGPYLNGERTETRWSNPRIIGTYETETNECIELSTDDAYVLSFSNNVLRDREIIEPENLLTPELVEYKFQMSEPAVPDEFYIDTSHPRDFYRTDVFNDGWPVSSSSDLLREYLFTLGSRIGINSPITLWDNNDKYKKIGTRCDFYVAEYGNNMDQFEEYTLDSGLFGGVSLNLFDWNMNHTFLYGRDGFNEPGYMLYYNEQEELPVEYEYILWAAIGLAQMWDEEMTPEEAIALLTTEQEIVDTYEEWQISVHDPRKVTHIIAKNPQTGQVIYAVIPKIIVEAANKVFNIEGFNYAYYYPIFQYLEYLDNGYLYMQRIAIK